MQVTHATINIAELRDCDIEVALLELMILLMNRDPSARMKIERDLELAAELAEAPAMPSLH